jgi:gliding motility-associated lipoprotein GldJ
MNKHLKSLVHLSTAALAVLVISSCSREKSSSTGWEFNNADNGGFEKIPYVEQETGPGLVLIEGGTFTMGRVEQDVMYDWNNIPRRISVSTFYMDETEVTNLNYREYLYWLRNVYGTNYPEVLKKAQDIREQEINLLNEKFQAEKAAAGVEDKAAKPVKKRGFFSKVWRVITYPFRAIAKVF